MNSTNEGVEGCIKEETPAEKKSAEPPKKGRPLVSCAQRIHAFREDNSLNHNRDAVKVEAKVSPTMRTEDASTKAASSTGGVSTGGVSTLETATTESPVPEVHPPSAPPLMSPSFRRPHSSGMIAPLPTMSTLPGVVAYSGIEIPPRMALDSDADGDSEMTHDEGDRDGEDEDSDEVANERIYRVGGAFVVADGREGGGRNSGDRSLRRVEEEEVLRRTLMDGAISVEGHKDKNANAHGDFLAGRCSCCRRRRVIIPLLFLMVAAVAVGIVVPLIVRSHPNTAGKGENQGSGSEDTLVNTTTISTPSSTDLAKLARFEHVQSSLLDVVKAAGLPPQSVEKLSTDYSDVTAATPQRQALTWLALEDERAIDPDEDMHSLVQRYALATFYFATGGENWTDDCGFLSSQTECDWNVQVSEEVMGWPDFTTKGISCTEENVTWKVMLPLNNLNGTIPEEIGLLNQILILIVGNVNYTDFWHGGFGGYYGGKLHGPLPESLSLLNWLLVLHVENHDLTGTIPVSFFGNASYLRHLSLMYNQLSGPIPSSFSNLSLLEYADFDSNLITGRLPPFGHLDNLWRISVWNNAMSGTIPPDINSLRALYTLYLDYNLFSSTLPFSYGSFPEIVILSLGTNRFNGTIPSSLYSYSSLIDLQLGNNLLSGTLSEEVGALSKLTALGVDQNLLTGTVPKAIANLTDLSTGLFLSHNYFTGMLPSELGKLEKLRWFFANNNVLEGSIPVSMGNMSGLEWLAYTWNVLTGSIPRSFEKLERLGTLFIDGNKLTGDIDFLCHIPLMYADCLGPNPFVVCSCCARCCRNYTCDPPRIDENPESIHALQAH